MKIIVASSGRAHLLDMARELQKQGHDVTFYSFTYKRYIGDFDFPLENYRSLLWLVAPFVFLHRKCHLSWARRGYGTLMDYYVALTMPKCDVFIAQSPYYTKSLLKAKKKHQAVTILDRGSSHVRNYNAIGNALEFSHFHDSYIREDENQYQIVDYITIPSDYAKETFIENGISEHKLFLNPYGFFPKHFSFVPCSDEYDVIMVGQWGKRKGCEMVVNALKETDYKLLHVGSMTMEFPELKNFSHIDPVQEKELIHYYQRAKIFLFPSYDDGFGLVLLQAAACGLPIICSRNCGGPTLKRMLNDTDNIYVMTEISSDEIINGLEYFKKKGVEHSDYMKDYLPEISWEAYGKRLHQFLQQL